jgi:hypothetical protein
MGKSFYLGTEEQLYIGSNSFTAKIVLAPTDYGLVAGQATAYQSLNTTWAAAYLAAKDPDTRTKAKVQAKNDAKVPLMAMLSGLAGIIEKCPTVTNEQRVLLGLSVRALPTPIGPPGLPTSFNATLNFNGSLDLSWKCPNPRGSTGTMYMVWRSIDNGEITYCGGCGSRKYTDTTVPPGTRTVAYQIQGVRSTQAGPFALFTVTFGMGSTTVTEQPAKIAA